MQGIRRNVLKSSSHSEGGDDFFHRILFKLTPDHTVSRPTGRYVWFNYHRNDVISRRHQRLGSQILCRILVFQETNPKPEMTTKYAISNSFSTHRCVLWRMSWCKNTLRSKWRCRDGGKGGWERQFIHYWATSDVANV